MFCSVLSAAISGVEAVPVSVEADVSDGMPVFSMVGYVSSQVREAQERVRTSLKNLGLSLPPKRITINLSPGYLRKEGTRFDLPIAAAVLEAMQRIPGKNLRNTMIIGELHLDGRVESVTGILPSVILAQEHGCTCCIVPAGNLSEGRMISGIRVIGIRNLHEFIDFCEGKPAGTDAAEIPLLSFSPSASVDFSDLRGLSSVKRAALIAAAGFHNILLSGPPGSGKSMTAERLPTILPDLSDEESLEITKIYSIVGQLPPGASLLKKRPFRAPHHTISASALCGGGMHPHPGEITLAHRGVLFLDELPEMNPSTLEMLRQPLETRQITISRMGGSVCFPASFLLAAAMNPCPCGYYPDLSRCTCTSHEISMYQSRISQALMDRIDLRCTVPAVSWQELSSVNGHTETSAQMRKKVLDAFAIQRERFQGSNIFFNSELLSRDLSSLCPLTEEAGRMLESAYQAFSMSARACHRIIKTARTIADLDHCSSLSETHISEALFYRTRDS